MKKYFKLSAMLLLGTLFALSSCKDEKKDDGYPLLPVKNLVATAGDAQVGLRWDAPANQYVQEYNLSWMPGSGSAVVEKGMTNYAVLGLENGKQYTFSVVAVYETGKSDAVSTVSTPAAAPVDYLPVTDFKATAGDTKVSLSWKKPIILDKAVLSGYTISVSPGDKKITVDDPAATSYELSGLTNGTAYTIKIEADYNDKGKSLAVSATVTPLGLIVGATLLSPADGKVTIDDKERVIEVYYNMPLVPLAAVKLNLTFAKGVETTLDPEQVFDLSDGKTGTVKVNDEVSYTVKAVVDPPITGADASYADLIADVGLGYSSPTNRSVAIYFGEDEIDKTAVEVSLKLSPSATLVSPKTNPATMDLSKGATIQVKDAKGETISYKVTCTGKQISGLFNPADITGTAIPSDWKRVTAFNKKTLPKSMALYQMTSYQGKSVNAYVVMWGKDAGHTVYSNAGEKKPFADYRTMSGADVPAVLIAGDSAETSYVVHNSEVLRYRPGALGHSDDPAMTCPCFALNNDGSWNQGSCTVITEGGKTVLANFDTGGNKWDAKEAFACGGFYLNPAAGGGFTSNGSTTLQSQCFFGVDAPADSKVAAFFICSKEGDAEGIIQDDVCKILISAGIKCGFPVSKKDAVGLDINGKEVFKSNGTPRFAVGIK